MLKDNKNIVDKIFTGDKVLWTVSIGLCFISILVVYSAVISHSFKFYGGNTEAVIVKHIFYVFLGLAAMWGAHKIPYNYYSGISRVFLIGSVVLLVLTLLVGREINGAKRWLLIPIVNIQFQPSDVAKFALVSNLASMLAKRQKYIGDRRMVMHMVLPIAVVVGLIITQDTSSALLLLTTCLIVLIIGRVSFKQIGSIGLMVLPLVGVAFMFGDRIQTAISRVQNFWTESESAQDIMNSAAGQLQYGYMAIARGGVTGVGPGNSTMRYFLPEAFSDFVFPVCIEEYGMIMGVIIVLSYLVIMYRGMSIASRSNTAFGGLLAIGLSFSLALQGLANIAVAVGIFPVTGLPLPFISMGGTSFLFTGITMGIINSVYIGNKELKEKTTNNNVKSAT